jgi:hypothetical protein
MEAVHKTREAAEIGRRQIYGKARDLVFFSADLTMVRASWSTLRWSIWKRAEKKRGKPFSRRRGARDWQVLKAA